MTPEEAEAIKEHQDKADKLNQFLDNIRCQEPVVDRLRGVAIVIAQEMKHKRNVGRDAVVFLNAMVQEDFVVVPRPREEDAGYVNRKAGSPK